MTMFPVYVIDIMLNSHADGVTLRFSCKSKDIRRCRHNKYISNMVMI
jgi:hypothetical protein